ncbi:MAG: restriction endonuclease subunit S [Saprospirales bacterium]|nr:restriction endonuclease subunit S [Saprospirales bacterium]
MENNLPEGWVETSLDQVCNLITDGTHRTPKYTESGIRFISIANVRPFQAITWNSYERYISVEEHLELIKRAKPEIDDILFPRIGTLGYAKRIDIEEEMSIFVGLGLAKPNKRLVLPKYLEYYMNTPFVYEYSTKNATGSGRLTLALRDSRMMPVRLPPLAEQHRIVAKLDALMERVERNKQRLDKIPALLKRFRQSVLAAAVSGRLTEGWRMRYGILDGWKEERLGDLVNVIGGVAYKSTSFLKEGQNQVFRIGNVKPYELYFEYSPVFVDDAIAKETERYEARVNDILISMTGTKYKRDYGYAGIVRDTGKRIFVNQRVSNIRCKSTIDPNYLLYWLQTDMFRNHFFSGETGNVNQGNVGMDGIREARIQLPALTEQTEIAKIVGNLFAFADKIEARYVKAKAMLDRLS